MSRLVVTALATAVAGGLVSAALGLGQVATYVFMVAAIVLTLPLALGVRVSDVRARLQRH
jgi:hypothetical protein